MIIAATTSMVILISILSFWIIILLLVTSLIIARNRLAPQGKVVININDGNTVEVSPGSTLLSTLSAQNIFLPSACGGGGTCGMCRCQVIEGGDRSYRQKQDTLHVRNKPITGAWVVR